jgi:GntR family transcriptional regulator
MVYKVDNEELSLKVRRVLLKILREGDYEKVGRLPPEEVLAQKIGVSRGVLRDVLATLEAEGFISRRRGIGTVINKQVVDIKTRIDVEKDFLEMVREAGYDAFIDSVNASWVDTNPVLSEKLEIPITAKVLAVEKRIVANGLPAIFMVDYIPEDIFVNKKYTSADLGMPIFRFLKKKCNVRVEIVLMELQACASPAKIAERLEIKEGEPVLLIPEQAYTFEQKPVLWSEVYYRNGLFNLTILRKNYLR